MPADLKVRTGVVSEITHKEVKAEFLKSQACVLCLPHIWPTIVRSGMSKDSELESICTIFAEGGDVKRLSEVLTEQSDFSLN